MAEYVTKVIAEKQEQTELIGVLQNMLQEFDLHPQPKNPTLEGCNERVPVK